MKFESIIKNISSIVSGVLVYLMAAGIYLNIKGFQITDDGRIEFIPPVAKAAEEVKEIPLDYAFPQDHVLGSEDAPVTLYEYSSFGCFHCADFHLDVLPKIQKEYIEKGLVRVVFVPFPLDKGAMDAALLAECVESDDYFSFIDVLFKKQKDWAISFQQQKVLLQYAALSGLNTEKAKLCLKDDIIAARILEDRKNAMEDLGISGTPSFVISSASSNEMVYGFRSFDEFKNLLDAHLPQKADNKTADDDGVKSN